MNLLNALALCSPCEKAVVDKHLRRKVLHTISENECFPTCVPALGKTHFQRVRGWSPSTHKIQLGCCARERSLSLLWQPTSWSPDIHDFNTFIVLMKSCKRNEHPQGNKVLIPSSRPSRDISTATSDSSLTLRPSDTVCVACRWLKCLLRPKKPATFTLPGVHGCSLSLGHGGVCLRGQYGLKAC